ncbi:MAG: LbetaH domain-containing protein [Planctomycetota bacterium]|jgi:putative colanic acid biosynthesis acetyltransferase WcaF
MDTQIDVSKKTHSPYSLKNKLLRVLWAIVYRLLFRPTPRPMVKWRAFLLKCFGADLTLKARVHATAKIWAPWNLKMGDYACIAPDVDCYNIAQVTIGAHATVSQYSYLCTASHDHTQPNMPVIYAPIVIEDQAWVCADVFIAPGVTVGKGAVVGARSSAFSDIPAWEVAVGLPAKPIGPRNVKPGGAPEQTEITAEHKH